MRVNPDSKRLAKKAHSVRWMTAAILLTGGELILFSYGVGLLPNGYLLGASLVCSIGGLISRFMLQRNMS